MEKQLQIMQANLGKSGIAQHSLMNDEGLKDHGLLLISEPIFFRHESDSVVHHPPSIVDGHSFSLQRWQLRIDFLFDH